ncbi:uncharacterized protein EV422DRAFT_309526 [Fimicolochytrium jonesii]|uniref:uncharacterized protein n=1 Tax=Fimicolochytrium jonesii TaxID=1396493 RepID=UPI0022FF2FA4|nr:uncharacterized protein EV422DRAFT_309526 [Fimicolochytrium jonesii]KAI8824157.1 hypothetical protein EV422DRAFT_309526 [Fimicolochytrium jonesii]
MTSMEDGGVGVNFEPRGRFIKENAFVEAIFGILYGMTQGNHLNPFIGLGIQMVEDLQLLSFSFQPQYGFGNLPSWMPYVFNPLSAKPHNYKGLLVLFYLAFGVTVANALLTVVVGISMRGSQMKVVWPLQLLRILTTALSTVLLIPIIEIFLHAFACYNAETDLPQLLEKTSLCFSSEYLPPFVLSITALIYLILQAPLIALVFFSIDPTAKDVHAKTTGRFDSVYNCLRIALAICLEVFRPYPQVALAAIIITSIVMYGITIRYQPYFVSWVNDLRAGIYFASLVSAIQAAIVFIVGPTEGPASFAVLCLLLLPSFGVGAQLCKLSRRRIAEGVYQRFRAKMAYQPNLARSPAPSTTLKRSASFLKNQRLTPLQQQILEESTEPDLELNSPAKLRAITTKINPKPIKVFKSIEDVEIACRFLQNNDDADARSLARKIFLVGVDQFPRSSQIYLLRAHYVVTFNIQGTDVAYDSLLSAKLMKPPFDIRFFLTREERCLEQDRRKEDLLVSSLNVTGYAELSSMEADARHYHLETLIAVKCLWQYMKAEKSPAAELPYLLDSVAHNRHIASRLYEKILSKFPRSKQIMRHYSNFLLTTSDDTEKAKKLFAVRCVGPTRRFVHRS